MSPNRRTDRAQFYSTVLPLKTRVAACEEFECDEWANGYVVSLPFEQASLMADVKESGRMFAEFWIADGEVKVIEWGPYSFADVDIDTLSTRPDGVVFRFPPGQSCFRMHRVPIGPPVMRYGTGTKEQLTAKPEWITETDPRAFVDHKRDTIERAYESGKREGVHEMNAERANAQKE